MMPCRRLPFSPLSVEKNPLFYAENTTFCSLFNIAKEGSERRWQDVPRLLAEAVVLAA